MAEKAERYARARGVLVRAGFTILGIDPGITVQAPDGTTCDLRGDCLDIIVEKLVSLEKEKK